MPNRSLQVGDLKIDVVQAQPEPQFGDDIPSQTDANLTNPPPIVVPCDSDGRPYEKRRRILMDAVEVPTLSSFKRNKQIVPKTEPKDVPWVYIKPEPLSEDDKVKLEFLRSNVSYFYILRYFRNDACFHS